MKKLVALALGLCLLLGAAGCSDSSAPLPETTPPGTVHSEPAETTAPSAPAEEVTSDMHALVMPTVREDISAEDGTLIFTMSYPNFQVVLNDPALEERITGLLHERLNGILSAAEEIHQSAESDYASTDPEYWYAYSLDVSYTPTRLDQSVLSLFGNRSRYSGGAHPSWVTDSVTYHLQTGEVLELEDILVSGYSKEALCSLVLKSLKDKADTLSHGYEEIITDRFTLQEEQPSRWYFSRTGLCFHFPPYDIAPYSSGTIIAEIPYQELQGLLREDLFPAPASDAAGSMYAQAYTDQTFTCTAEVSLSSTAAPVVLYSDATVTDVRIETGSLLSDRSGFISSGVVFMADALDIGDAILLYADLSDSQQLLRLVYRSGEHEVSSLITQDAAGNVVLSGS